MTVGDAGTGSAAWRTAERLRSRILSGDLQPGQRLSEQRFREELGVSRSTLREAFQVLIRDRLLVHHLSRGVFVRTLDREDLQDLYAVRRAVECGALRAVSMLDPAVLRRMNRAVSEGRAALEANDWQRMAAASIAFHEALVGLARSRRLDEVAHRLLAEFRLAYGHMGDTTLFHAQFLVRNEKMAALISSGDLTKAADVMDGYLRDSEDALLREYDSR